MATWHAKRTGGYSRTTTEAKENAEMCYGVLNSLGWALESVAAVLGNQEGESVYNPWRWQGDNVLNYGDYRIGEIPPPLHQYGCAYGLFQQDPAAKYLKRPYAMALPTYAPNYNDRAGQPYDGDAQLRYLHWICSDPSGGEWDADTSHSSYNMSFTNFYTNGLNKTVEYLTHTFFKGYERGTWDAVRVTAANYWYDYLGGVTPPTPPTPPTPTGRKLPLIFYIRYPF